MGEDEGKETLDRKMGTGKRIKKVSGLRKVRICGNQINYSHLPPPSPEAVFLSPLIFRMWRLLVRHPGPVVDAASLLEALFVPVDILQRRGDADLEDGFRGFADAKREKKKDFQRV